MTRPGDRQAVTGAGEIRPGVRRVFAHEPAGAAQISDAMDEEIRLHLEARTAELEAQGWSATDAAAEARRRFGRVDDARRRLHASAAQRSRRLRWRDRGERIMQDLGYAVRGLRRTPSFTAGVVGTLALGLGINSAAFRIVDRLFLKAPAAVHGSSAIRRVAFLVPGQAGALAERQAFPYPTALMLSTVSAFSGVAIYTAPVQQKIDDGHDVVTSTIGPGYVELLGLRPTLGRFFTAEELRPLTGIASIVISYPFWIREFGGDPAVVGRALSLKGVVYHVVGVAPREFIGVDLDPVDLWIPLGIGRFGRTTINGVDIPWFESTGLLAVRILARMRPGVADQTAETAATNVTQQPVGAVEFGHNPVRLARERVALRSLNAPDGNDKAYLTSLRILSRFALVAGLILAMAGANTANLLLARALRRRREIAVRLALGISRMRLIGQLITEGALLGSAAAVVAVVAGYWASAALRTLLFPRARWNDAAFDARTVVFTLGLSVTIGVLAGLVPALRASRPQLTTVLGGTGIVGRHGRRWRDALVIVQAALSVVLLISAGLFIQSLRELDAVDLGIAPDGLITAAMPINAADRAMNDRMIAGTFNVSTMDEWVARTRALPGVRSVALASLPPFDAVATQSLSIPGRDSLPDLDSGGPFVTGVTPEYIGVMGMRVLHGRGIAASDNAGAPNVVVVNSTMAKTYWPGQEVLGQCLKVGGPGHPCSEIIGVVQDVRDKPDAIATARYYIPLEQMSPSQAAAAVVIRTVPERTGSILATLRRIVFLGAPVRFDPVADRIATALRPWRMGTLMFAGLGALALVLASVGLCSTLLYTFSERQREIGVRLALGASGRSILTLVVGTGLRLVAAGFVVGAVLALLISHAMASVIFRVSIADPAVYLATAFTLVLAAAIASLWPAWRVRTMDPADVLRLD